MFKLCIALGWSVIKMQLQYGYLVQYPELWGKINQHRFIMSDNIDAYYSEKADKDGLLTEYQDFISAISGTDLTVEIRDIYNNYERNLSDYLKNKCKSVALVIHENDELKISKSSCRYQYSIEDACNNARGLLGMYSYVSSFYIDEGENAVPYLEWIKNIISEEKEISIIDPYLLREQRNYDCLINYCFPIIPHGCVLNLHVPNDSLFIDQAKEEANNANIHLKIYKYRRMKHDRYITTSKREILIGIGLDFMKEKNGRLVMRGGSNFTLRSIHEKLPYMQYEHMLAGELE